MASLRSAITLRLRLALWKTLLFFFYSIQSEKGFPIRERSEADWPEL